MSEETLELHKKKEKSKPIAGLPVTETSEDLRGSTWGWLTKGPLLDSKAGGSTQM